MSDGTVSIFGLVFGVAASATSSAQVLLAGTTGAVAAAVSMAAGVFLDEQSEADQARVRLRSELAAIDADPVSAAERVLEPLAAAGVGATAIAALRAELVAEPRRSAAIASLHALREEPPRTQVVLDAAWMLVASLCAGLAPALPFLWLPIPEARRVTMTVTLVLLVLLGLARARIGERPVASTILQTVSIAAAAGVAGVAIGRWAG
jgi:VIT1/CCC1 family predicted Fe2+/Mn2+ transporter